MLRLAFVIAIAVLAIAPHGRAANAEEALGYSALKVFFWWDQSGNLVVVEQLHENFNTPFASPSYAQRISPRDGNGRPLQVTGITAAINGRAAPLKLSGTGTDIVAAIGDRSVQLPLRRAVDSYTVTLQYAVIGARTRIAGVDVLTLDLFPQGLERDVSLLEINVNAPNDDAESGLEAFKAGPCAARPTAMTVTREGTQSRFTRENLSAHQPPGAICLAWRPLTVLTVSPATPSGSTQVFPVARIPFVGCSEQGMAEDLPAPTRQDLQLRIDPRVAADVAFYQGALGAGILAPRGWHCLRTSGSAGEMLLVQPAPLMPTTLATQNDGPVVVLTHSIGGTSGRYGVAQLAARFFPRFHAFVESVKRMGLYKPDEFPGQPYPADRLAYLNPDMVEYETPAGAQGLGTRALAASARAPISGVAFIYGDGSEPDTRVLSVRMMPNEVITHEVLRLIELSLIGAHDPLAVPSEAQDVDWSALQGDWSDNGNCDVRIFRAVGDGLWRTLENRGGRMTELYADPLTIIPIWSQMCVFPPESDNGGCFTAAKLNRTEFTGSYLYAGNEDSKPEPFAYKRCAEPTRLAAEGMPSPAPPATNEVPAAQTTFENWFGYLRSLVDDSTGGWSSVAKISVLLLSLAALIAAFRRR